MNRNFKNIRVLVLATVAIAIAAVSCRTTEANYRQAYEQAVAGREQRTDIEDTVYGKNRREIGKSIVRSGNDSIEVVTQRVVLEDPRDDESLRPQYYVIARFKQLFNAKSYRDRLRKAGFDEATLLKTAEPLYYVAVGPVDNDAQWIDYKGISMSQIRTRPPFPILLRTTLRTK